MTCPFASVPSAMTALLYFLWYGSLLKYGVRFASWPLSPSVRASVNGTSNTVGSVPAASLAAKVGAVHWYSTGLILMLGFAFSNCETWVLNCWTAAAELPGINDATLIVTAFAPDVAPAADAETVPVQREHRPRVVGLCRHGKRAPAVGLSEPARCPAVRAESVRRRVAAPGQRRPAAVAAGIGAVRPMPDRIAPPCVRDVLHLGKAELLALVHVQRAGQRHSEQRGGTGAPCSADEIRGRDPVAFRLEGERRVRAAVAGDRSRDVVIRQHRRRRRVHRCVW